MSKVVDNPNIEFTLHFLQGDTKDHPITAFVEEFPQAIAQGKTNEEAHRNVIAALSLVLKYIAQENFSKEPLGKSHKYHETKSLQLSFA